MADKKAAAPTPAGAATELDTDQGASPIVSGGAEKAADPFDLEALRSAPLDLDLERVMTTVPVRKPKRTEFFRVNPDPEFVVDCYVIEHESGLDRDTYWVSRELLAELQDELRLVRLLTCISRQGTVYLWPAKLPVSDNNSGRVWAQSALRAAEEAKTLWVRMMGNKDLGAYEYVRAKGDLGEPQWPAKSFRELLKVAFDGKLIDRLDHPVLRELFGEI